ncbi:hypothetical protein BDV93DRAFT_517431 [Ceratobasidium sp. AG-I]|nr:hypothetical protein BDV93DRAFT_517431 [Ceratobasidium sp. AG-I]
MARESSSHSNGDALVKRGYLLVLISLLIILFGIYSSLLAPLLSYFELPPIAVHRLFTNDTHYKYFPFLVVPAGLLFVIANWVGWQYYQNS